MKKIYMPSGRKGIFKIIIITAVTLCLMAAFTGCSKGGAEQAENKDGYVYVPEYKEFAVKMRYLNEITASGDKAYAVAMVQDEGEEDRKSVV